MNISATALRVWAAIFCLENTLLLFGVPVWPITGVVLALIVLVYFIA